MNILNRSDILKPSMWQAGQRMDELLLLWIQNSYWWWTVNSRKRVNNFNLRAKLFDVRRMMIDVDVWADSHDKMKEHKRWESLSTSIQCKLQTFYASLFAFHSFYFPNRLDDVSMMVKIMHQNTASRTFQNHVIAKLIFSVLTYISFHLENIR